MANLINPTQKLAAGSQGYVEATYDNEIVDASTILLALNGPEGQATGITYTGINTPITDPISGTRQISFTVSPNYTPTASEISSSTYDELNQVPGISNVSMGNVYGGAASSGLSSIVNNLLGQDTGTSNTSLYVIVAIIVVILILLLFVEKNA